ncbi:transmembrane alpha-helix domain-containing protein [Colletotrichum asianum]
MRAAAVFLAAVIRFAFAQDKDGIPRCSWDCLGLTPSDTCHIRIDPECACGIVVTDARRSQLGSCVGTYCKNGTTFDDVWPPLMAYCVANDWLNSSQTALASTVTVTPIVIATLTTSVTNPSVTTDATSIANSTPATESGSLTAQAATPAQSATVTAEPTSTSDGDNSNTSSGGMSAGEKAGIGIGIALVLVFGCCPAFPVAKKEEAQLNWEHTIPELGSGDKSNRHELDSYIIPPKAEKTDSETVSNQQVMAELDGTPCASPRPEVERYEDRPPAELSGTLPEVMPVTSQTTSVLERGTNIAQPMIGDHINSKTSEPSLPSTAELEHLLHEEQLLRERRRTLEQLKQIQEDELASGERIRLLRQRHSSQSAEGGG